MGEARAAIIAAAAIGAALTGAGCWSNVPAPADLTVVENGDFDQVYLTWSNRCSDCSVEAAYGLYGSLTTFTDPLVPPGVRELVAEFRADSPELVAVTFRLRAHRGGDLSPWSAPAVLQRGVRPPMIEATASADGRSVHVAWTNRSWVADELVLLRETAGPGSGTSTVTLTTDLAASAFDDAAPDGVPLTYRLRYGAGGTWSLDSRAGARLPLRQPADLAAGVVAEGVTLTWTPRTQAATAQQVHCTPCPGEASVPPDAGTFLAPGFPPWPAAAYWIEAFQSVPVHHLRGDLPIATLPPFLIQAAAVTLVASAGPYPEALRIKDADGAWYDWSQQGAGTEVVRHAPDGATPVLLSGERCLGLKHDGGGNPHLVAVVGMGFGAEALAHHWHDAAGWHTETSASMPAMARGAWFGVDAAGAVELAYARLDEGAGLVVVHGTVSAGVFTWSDILGIAASSATTAFALAPDGWAHVTGWAGGGPAIASRPPGGSWQVEPMPFGAYAMYPGLAGDLAIHRQDSFVGYDLHVEFAERIGGIWSPVETVGPQVNGGRRTLGRSDDGARWAMTVDVADPGPDGARTDLFLRGPDGWTQTQVTMRQAAITPAFLPDGRLVLTAPGVVWEEQ